MTATKPLVALLSSGTGPWFALCRWCRQTSPAVPARDDLRVLAAAKGADWLVRKNAEGYFCEAEYVVVCRPCRRARGEG